MATENAFHWLTVRRTELSLTQDELSKRLKTYGFSFKRAAISQWENFKYNPPLYDPKFRIALADALELPLVELLKLAGYEVQENETSDFAVEIAELVDLMPEAEKQLIHDVVVRMLQLKRVGEIDRHLAVARIFQVLLDLIAVSREPMKRAELIEHLSAEMAEMYRTGRIKIEYPTFSDKIERQRKQPQSSAPLKEDDRD